MTQKTTRSGRSGKRNGAKGAAARPAEAHAGGAAKPKRRRGRPTRQESKQREEEYAQFGDERLIHRYGNRRFYDLRDRRAVTLQEIGDMVRRGEDVRVLDVDAGNQDITRRVLTQIILEENSQQTLSRLPIEFLRRLIATQGQDVTQWLDSYLKVGVDMIDRGIREGLPAMWSFQKQFNEIVANPAAAGPSYADGTKKRERERELEELRRRIDELAKEK